MQRASTLVVVVLWGGLAVRGGLAQTCDPQQWRPEKFGPEPRFFTPLSYDPHRGVAVLFSGIGGNTRYSDTWELNLEDRTWRNRTVANQPQRRDTHCLVYDPVRRKTLLFGGDLTSGGGSNDTWEWDGVAGTWTQLFPKTQPSPRQGAAMFHCPERGSIILYGGRYNGTIYGDTWEWNSGTVEWTELPSGLGPARSDTEIVKEPRRGGYLMFGGYNANFVTTDETWHLEPTALVWTRLEPEHRPVRRCNAVIATDSASQRVVMFGGFGPQSSLHSDSWWWDADARDWREIPSSAPPPARGGAGGVYDPARDELLVFGGDDGGPNPAQSLSDLWSLAGAGWTQIMATQPIGTFLSMQAAYDPHLDRTVVYWGGPGRWTTEMSSTGWHATSGFEPHITQAPLVFDGSRVIMLGQDQTNPWSTWGWEGGQWVPLTASGPSPRTGYGVAYDSQRNRVVLFGGTSPTEYASAETWEWDGQEWRLVAIAPFRRRDHAMAYDPALGATLLYGGTSVCSNCPPHDTWAWNGVYWFHFTSQGPYQGVVSLAYDDWVGRVVMVTPSVVNYGVTYEWHGTSWLPGPTLSAPLGPVGPITYDQRRRRLVHFSGITHSIRGCECYPNCDGSTILPRLNVSDFVCFMNRFAAGDAYANCDGSTVAPVLNVSDFVCFQSRYAAGCP